MEAVLNHITHAVNEIAGPLVWAAVGYFIREIEWSARCWFKKAWVRHHAHKA